MTLGWNQRFTRETYLNGNPIPACYLVEGTLRVGTSYLYAPGRTIDLSFGIGVTPDTPQSSVLSRLSNSTSALEAAGALD